MWYHDAGYHLQVADIQVQHMLYHIYLLNVFQVGWSYHYYTLKVSTREAFLFKAPDQLIVFYLQWLVSRYLLLDIMNWPRRSLSWDRWIGSERSFCMCYMTWQCRTLLPINIQYFATDHKSVDFLGRACRMTRAPDVDRRSENAHVCYEGACVVEVCCHSEFFRDVYE